MGNSKLTVAFGGPRPTATEEKVARGEHPRAEYGEMLRAAPGESRLVTFDDLATARSPLVRAVAGRMGPYWGLAALLCAEARGGDHPGTVITTGEDVGLPIALMRRLTGARFPLRITTHGSYFASRKWDAALRLLRTLPDLDYFCLSGSLQRELAGRAGLPAGRVVDAGYGVDTRFFRPDAAGDVSQDAGLVVAAGMAQRDYRTLVDALGGRPGVNVRIAADSLWFQNRLDVAEGETPGNVRLGSAGDYVGLRALYARAAVVAVPLYNSRHACGYAVIAEAMAMGRPVVATRTDSPGDYIVDGENGFLVPPGDAGAMREKVELLLADPALRHEMGRRARSRIEESFSLESYAARLLTGLRAAEEGGGDRTPAGRDLPATAMGGAR